MAILRKWVEQISRRQVLRRRLPADLGGATIWVTPDAALRFLRPNLDAVDPMLFRAARDLVRAGDVVWDVGANVGLFTFAAAARAERDGLVLAVEADTWLVDLLRRSARSQPPGSSPVVVLPVAVSNKVDVAEFEIASRGRCPNHLAGLGGSQTGGTREHQHVVSVTCT
ncbi:MAG TPA: hypothetical protein PK157_21970 [Bryobacteraceae bacterium]|nr:hypothetical protein [Bryobacteraceae bacterium]